MKTAILLISTGSPRSCKTKDVAAYLSRFLNNKRIISLPYLLRSALVNFIIVPCKAKKSAKRYKQLTDMYNGEFPLLYHCNSVKKELEKTLPADIYIGMSYGKPYIGDTIREILSNTYEKLIVLPMFPHYTSSATGVPFEIIMKEFSISRKMPEIVTINGFHKNEGFINSFAEKIKEYNPHEYDDIIFTYHSLPLSHIKKYDKEYFTMCDQTTELICAKLNIGKKTTCFQSQMNNKWLGPSAESILLKLAGEGKKKILVVSPSFVLDCIETDIEIGVEMRDFFIENGGKELTQVKSLNDSPVWINSLKEIVTF